MTINPLRVDPTRTTMLRHQFEAEMARRFRRLQKSITKMIVTEDAFGLSTDSRNPFTGQGFVSNQRWRFLSNVQKVAQFKQWLNSQVQQEILQEGEGTSVGRFIQSAWRKGVDQAYFAARRAKMMKAGEYNAAYQEFLQSSFGGSISLERVQLLQTRAFELLEGITKAMASKVTDTLTDGFIRGINPNEIAKNLNQEVSKIGINRARTLARTEVIRAHAEGSLDGFEKLGVTEIGARIEWSSSPDSRRCKLCESLHGVVFTVKRARGLLPRHPNCRCSWKPVFKPSDKDKAVAAIRDSIAKEHKRKTMKKKIADSRWVGADLANL